MFYKPGIYYIQEDKFMEQKCYSLIYHKDRFETPKKLYGDTMTNIIRVWNEYAISKKTTGVLFTGTKGSGKTMMSSLLCNLAIDNNLPVVMCIEVEFTIELIRFLSQLKHAVLFMDEFNKNIAYHLQEKALTMLSDINSTNKLIIMTENSIAAVNPYIIDRPGRVRYHFDFEKLSRSVFEDYCKQNMDIDGKDNKFYKELFERYTDLRTFSFDQLQAIVTEHSHYPDDDLETLFNILNLHGLSRPKKFVIEKVVNLTDNTKLNWDVDESKLTEKRFKLSTMYDTPTITLLKKEEEKVEVEEPMLMNSMGSLPGLKNVIGNFRLPPEDLRQDPEFPDKYFITIDAPPNKYRVFMKLVFI